MQVSPPPSSLSSSLVLPKEIPRAVPFVGVSVSTERKILVSPCETMYTLFLVSTPRIAEERNRNDTHMYVMLLLRLGCSVSG